MNKKQVKEQIPLDYIKVTVINSKTDELEDLSVLHPNMCKYFLCGCEYEKLQIEEDNDVEISIKMLDKLLTNLQWLLSLHYEQFWCQVINDKFVHSCLDSYLRHAPRYEQPLWPDEVLEKHAHVHRAVFMVFLRMSTSKESDENFMTKKFFSKLIYENYLFDIPRLMDLCSLYGMQENRPLLKKMLKNIFHSQEKFFDDLNQAAKTVSEILLNIEEKCLGTSESEKLPNKLSDGQMNLPLHSMTEAELADVTFYISDIARTLQSFIVDIFSEASQAFFDNKLIERLITLYTEILPAIREILRDQERTLGGAIYLELRGHLRQARDYIMNVANAIIQNLSYEPAMKASEQNEIERADDFAEKYFQILSSFLSYQQFFDDFCKKFNIRKSVENISKICPNVGEAHSQFFFNSVPENQSPGDESSDVAAGSGDGTSDQPGSSKASASPQVSSTSDSQLAPLVTAIRDVLPDYDIDLIKKCLVYYELDPEKVIQAIFEQNLPPHLTQSLVQNGREHASDQPGSSKQQQTIENHSSESSTSKSLDFLHERKNIFDNDEFDVFAKGSNIDKSRIHYGKKDKGKVGHWTADAEEDVEKLRLLYNRYGLGAEDTDNELMLLRANPVSNYDDEYDDTYDDVAVGANDADSVDELGDQDDGIDEDEEEEERPRQNYRNRHFVQNPEDLRAKEDERRKRREDYFSRRGGKTNRQSRTPQGSNSGPASSNTTNEDKSGDRKKRDFKQSRGHNRRTLATKKASKGMFMTS